MHFIQDWPRPSKTTEIVIIGAGGIVKDSHLPAYRNGNYPVRGIWNRNPDRARALGEDFEIGQVFDTLEQATSYTDVIYDIATSPQVHVDMLERLPDGVPVLIQKPMGLSLEVANAIRAVCERKGLKAAVNFQLRFAPMMLAIRNALEEGFFGQMIDIEVHLNLLTPWHLFPNLRNDPRIEIVAHSIHYIDLIQSLVGVPQATFARGFRYPGGGLADTRTSAILNYGKDLRATLSINHHHDFGRPQQASTIRFEGTEGAAVVKLGVLMDYPHGEPDELWIGRRGETLEQIPLGGHWFPDAFEHVMSNMQRFVNGEDDRLETSVASAWDTMAIVESCYASAALPMEPVPQYQPMGKSV
ncbi:Gfo/Idh/MocA family protein [Ruegeria jejuensis]|uniref:Gfo/Idh/MocA family protein n=1 Tax=Ruegeria jejuensis TaxID=3233338 RepID=UPI00355C3F66